MEVECLALKDLTSSRKSFAVEPNEDGGQSEQKVGEGGLIYFTLLGWQILHDGDLQRSVMAP